MSSYINGYLKIHRRFKEWEWYKDANTMRVFLHLLLNVQWKKGNYMGHEIPIGSVPTGYKALSEQLGISVKNARTAISHLKKTGEITVEVASKFSIINVVKYRDYQDDEQVGGKQTASKRQADGKQAAPYEEGKNGRKKEDKLDYSVWPELPSDEVLKDWLAMRKRLRADVSQTVINRLAKKFLAAKEKGLSVDDCLGECVERSWKGFDIDWVIKDGFNQGPSQQQSFNGASEVMAPREDI